MVLTEPWTFSLYSEGRNDKFIGTLQTEYLTKLKRKLNVDGYYGWGAQLLGDFTIPTGAQLSVARIYIRLGGKEFDSVTFNVNYEVESPRRNKLVKIKGRFWVKLKDANKIKMELLWT